MEKKLSTPTILLFVLCLTHLTVNILWLFFNKFPLSWDPAGHTRLAIEFSQYFQGTLRQDLPFLSISSYYPPLTHLLTSVLIVAYGPSVFITALPITFYFIGTLAGIYLLVKKVNKNEWIAFFTAAFLSFYPPIYENSRQFLLEIPLLFWLSWALYFLADSNLFEKKKSVVLFTIASSALLLTKWIGIFFILIPLLAVLYQRWKKGWHEKTTFALISSAITISLLTLPWYVSNLDRLLEIGKLASQGEITDPQSTLSIDNVLFYFKTFLNFQLTLWPALVAIFGLISYFFHKSAPFKVLLILILSTGYGTFTLISNKDIRYTLPLLFIFAFTSAYMLLTWSKKKFYLGATLLGGSLFYLILQYFILSFHLLPTYQQAWNLGPLGWIDYVNTGDIVVHHPRSDNTPNQAILDYFLLRHPQESISIMVGVDQPDINPSTLDFFIVLNNYWQLSLEAPYNVLDGFNSESELKSYLSRFDYFLIATGQVGPDAVRHKKALEQIRDFVIANRGTSYQELKYFSLANHPGEVLVFKHVD